MLKSIRIKLVRASAAVATAVFLTLFGPYETHAQSNNLTKDQLDNLERALNLICRGDPTGQTIRYTVDAKAKAELLSIFKNLADAGGSAAGKVEAENYTGVLRDKLGSEATVNYCRLKVWDDLKSIFFSKQGASTQSIEPQSTPAAADPKQSRSKRMSWSKFLPFSQGMGPYPDTRCRCIEIYAPGGTASPHGAYRAGTVFEVKSNCGTEVNVYAVRVTTDAGLRIAQFFQTGDGVEYGKVILGTNEIAAVDLSGARAENIIVGLCPFEERISTIGYPLPIPPTDEERRLGRPLR